MRLDSIHKTVNGKKYTSHLICEAYRDNGRTRHRTIAKRRSVIKSVLISLRQNLRWFSLHGILEEVTEWCRSGISLFRRQLQELRAADKPPPASEFVEPALA